MGSWNMQVFTKRYQQNIVGISVGNLLEDEDRMFKQSVGSRYVKGK
jgi:hypothetical protein